MADDWKPGDLAVCVKTGFITDCPCGIAHSGEEVPPLGSALKVAGISTTRKLYGADCDAESLVFASGRTGLSQRFRKVRPDQHEPCEAEFVTLLKRKQVRA